MVEVTRGKKVAKKASLDGEAGQGGTAVVAAVMLVATMKTGAHPQARKKMAEGVGP